MLSKLVQKAHYQGNYEFVYDVVNGKLYEKYRDAYNSMFGITTINREAAKKIILKILYSKNSHFKKEKEIFRNLYPGVEDLIRIILQVNL